MLGHGKPPAGMPASLLHSGERIKHAYANHNVLLQMSPVTSCIAGLLDDSFRPESWESGQVCGASPDRASLRSAGLGRAAGGAATHVDPAHTALLGGLCEPL